MLNLIKNKTYTIPKSSEQIQFIQEVLEKLDKPYQPKI